jgi:hypothetical protein
MCVYTELRQRREGELTGSLRVLAARDSTPAPIIKCFQLRRRLHIIEEVLTRADQSVLLPAGTGVGHARCSRVTTCLYGVPSSLLMRLMH